MWTRSLVAAWLLAASMLTLDSQRAESDLFSTVLEALRRCPQYTIFDDVTIAVADGVVTLAGQVTSHAKRSGIASHIAGVSGVRAVVNGLEVLPASNVDADLRLRLGQALYGHATFWRYASMPSPPIHIIVIGRHVRLIGTVSSDVERALAQSLAQVEGVLGVKNELRVERTPAP